MTEIALSMPRHRTLSSLLGAEPLFAAAGILVALSLLVTVPALFLDDRLFQAENVWIKPITFQLSLALYLLTLAFFARWLPAGMTGRRAYRLFAAAVVFAIIAELVWIGMAAMYAVASHFNQTNPLMVTLYPVMGALAVLLTAASLVYGIAIWRNAATGLAPALHLSIALGLILTFVLTVPVASFISSMPGHGVGVPADGARLPLLGWSRQGGDLRVTHFLATHALQILPLIGLVLSRTLPERMARAGVWISAVLLVALVMLTLMQALMGQPLVPVLQGS